jgi:sporulation integral membrane protein YlbJ
LNAYKFFERGVAAIKTGVLKLKRILYFAAFLIAFAALLIYSKTAATAALDGLKISAAVLIPSLFPLSVISGMTIRLGIAEPICAKIGKPFKKLFGVSENGAIAFVLGLLGGYPLGITTAVDLYKNSKVTGNDLKRLICFCSNCSPAFIVGVAAPRFAGAPQNIGKISALLFIAHVSAAITAGIIFKNIPLSEPDTFYNARNRAKPRKPYTFASAFTESVEVSAASMLKLAAYISLFYIINKLILSSYLIAMIEEIHGMQNAGALTAGVLEFSTGILNLVKSIKSLPAAAFLLGFGGFCVAAQSASALKDTDVGIKYYVFAKLFQGAAAYIITALIMFLCGILQNNVL